MSYYAPNPYTWDGLWQLGNLGTPDPSIPTLPLDVPGALAAAPPSPAIEIGTPTRFAIINTANTGTVTTALTVPSDATFVLVGATAFQGLANGLASLTLTKGGVDTAMVKVTPAADVLTTTWQSALFYMVAPDTGANMTLKWDWIGAGVSADNDMLFSVRFFKNVDTDSPIRDADAAQAAGVPFTTPLLTAQPGDRIEVWVGGFRDTAEGSINTWSPNLLLVENLTMNADADAAWAGKLAGGKEAVSALTSTNWHDGGINAVVIKPLISTDVNATLAATIDPFTLSATADLLIQGTFDQPMGDITLSANADLLIQGTFANTIDPVTLTASADLVIEGDFTQTIPDFTLAAEADLLLQGTFNATIPPVTLAAEGDLLIQGTFNNLIDPVTLVATGGSATNATFDQTIPDFTLAATGTLVINGTFSQTIPDFTLAATANLPIIGTFNGTIDPVVMTSSADLLIQGTLNGLIDPVTLDANGSGTASGNFLNTIDPVTLVATGETGRVGSFAATIDPVTLNATGELVAAGAGTSGGPMLWRRRRRS